MILSPLNSGLSGSVRLRRVEPGRRRRILKRFFAGAALALALPVLAASAPEPSPFAVADEAAFFELLDLDQPALAAVRTAVQAHDWQAAKQAWAQHLSTRTSPHWLWSRRDRPAFQQIYDAQFNGLARYTNAADRVLARDFTLLDVHKQLAPQVEWLHGPIEWTHVLSRFGYWHDLGLAYWGTGDSRYAADFVDLLEQWIQANPVPAKVSNSRGTNGSVWRTLEAGIRSQGWFESMELFMDASEFDAEAKYLMTRSLVEHARYLDAWLTVYRRGNWQVCEASGLATVGLMLPEFKEAAGWRAGGFKFLVEHMQKDVLPDGAHSELTPGYHTWVMNQFTTMARLAKSNGVEIPGLLERHEKMFEFLLALSRPDRTFPPVGDAGIGSTIKDSMGRGAWLYQRPDFRFFAGDKGFEDWLWLFGPNAGAEIAAQTSRPPAFTSVLLPSAQYMVMRSGWQADARYLLFDCAPWGSSHSHQDRLQVTVFAGRDLIVDSGMCSYDQSPRRDLLKTAAHSVVMIDGQEQLNVNPELLAWHTGPAADFASGRIAKVGLSLQRSVLFVKPGYWVVVDHIAGEGEHEVTRLFHFPAGSEAKADGNVAQTAFNNGMNIRVQSVCPATLEMRQAMHAGENKSVVFPAPVAALVAKGKLPLTLGTVLLPYAEAKELPQVRAVKTTDPQIVQFCLEFPNGQRDEIAIAAESSQLAIGAERAKTRALCVRRGPVANEVIAIPDGIGAATFASVQENRSK
jgi:hypothetical protein